MKLGWVSPLWFKKVLGMFVRRFREVVFSVMKYMGENIMDPPRCETTESIKYCTENKRVIEEIMNCHAITCKYEHYYTVDN